MDRPLLRRAGAGLALALLAALGASCSPLAWGIGGGVAGVCAYAPSRWNHGYQTRYQPPHVKTVEADTAQVRLSYVEFDDFGWMRDTTQARVLLDSLQALHARTNVAVIVYAHGWRHNAKDGDADLASFEATLRHLARNLNTADFRGPRAALTRDPNMTIFGIYVGWRGKAWPELGRVTRTLPYLSWLGPATLDLPIYFTSSSRKQTAGVVGTGDVRTFLLRLDDLHREINARARLDPVAVKPLGLVYVGHSYGGHLMFSALSSRIEDNLGTAIAGSAAKDGRGLAGRAYPPEHLERAIPCDSVVRGVGDLLVLVNPAIEASAYRRIDGMVRSAEFREDQLPLMVTVSAENDFARNGLFKLMRGLQLFGRAKQKGRQQELEGQAFGAYGRQVTHQMELVDKGDEAKQRARLRVIEEGRDQLSVRRAQADTAKAAARPEPQPADLFALHVHGVVRMSANTGMERPRPALVVRSKRDVIDGHSDFFRVEFIDWLTDYVLSIEQVRLANAMRAARAAGR